MTKSVTFVAARSGPHHLMLGSVIVSRLLGGKETAGEFSLMDVHGLPGSGPRAHIDPWRETFYVLEGELTFEFEEGGKVRAQVARNGDTVSIPAGVGHAFSISGKEPARYLIIGSAAGIDTFFADAGQSVAEPVLPTEPIDFDRERLRAAFAQHGHPPYSFPLG